MTAKLRSELTFGSLLVYLSGSDNERKLLERNHAVIAAIKNDKPIYRKELGPDYLARVFTDRCEGTRLNGFIGPGDLLVPIPRSSPPPSSGAPWPARRIADALHSQGLGQVVLPLLERVQAIPSASRDGGRRLARIHSKSSRARSGLLLPSRSIVLIDDVVSSGATALGMARCLDRVYPDLEIRLFAVARTLTPTSKADPHQTLGPVMGTIRLLDEERAPQRIP